MFELWKRDVMRGLHKVIVYISIVYISAYKGSAKLTSQFNIGNGFYDASGVIVFF